MACFYMFTRMLNRLAETHDLTSDLKALPGTFNITRLKPSILNLSHLQCHS